MVESISKIQKTSTKKPTETFESLAPKIEENKKSLKREDFETIKKLGEGNFTEIYKVLHKGVYFALKVC